MTRTFSVTVQVIETKRQPPIWGVKHRHFYRAVFHGPAARTQAEAYAAENYGEFEVREKQPTGKEIRRAAKLAEAVE